MGFFSSLKTSLTCFASVTVTTGNWLQHRGGKRNPLSEQGGNPKPLWTMAHCSEVQHPPVETGFIIPSSWGVCGDAQVLLTLLNETLEHKDAFLLGWVYKGRDLQPCPGPWDELSLFLLHPGVPSTCALIPVPVPCGHHVPSPCLGTAPISFLLPCSALCFPPACLDTHQPTPVCTSPCPRPSVPTLFAEGLLHCIGPALLEASKGKNRRDGMSVGGAWRGSVAPVPPGLSFPWGGLGRWKGPPHQRVRNELLENGAGTLIPSWCDPEFDPTQLTRVRGCPCLAPAGDSSTGRGGCCMAAMCTFPSWWKEEKMTEKRLIMASFPVISSQP